MTQIKFRLPTYFQDNMLLQQGISNRVYGQSKANSDLTVILERFPAALSARPTRTTESETGKERPSQAKQRSGSAKITQSKSKTEFGTVFSTRLITDQRGFFDFLLPAMEASGDYYRLTLTIENHKCVFNNILFGEVWLAIGGSNMAMPAAVSDLQGKISQYANLSYLRLFTMSENGLAEGQEDYLYHPTARIAEGKWHIPNKTILSRFSAVALAFAAAMQINMDIPVAIYNLSARATMLHSWLPRDVIESDRQIKEHLQEIGHYRDLSDWNSLTPFVKAEEAKSNRPVLRSPFAFLDKTPIRPLTLPEKDSHSHLPFGFIKQNQPTAMYNHKLAPLTGLSIRGVIFYQGETEVFYTDYYHRALKAFAGLIKESFHSFKRGPYFIYNQLTPYLYDAENPYRLAYFNEMLTGTRRELDLTSAIVSNYDLPLDYAADADHAYAHPLYPLAKEQLGQRMYHLAKGLVYQIDSPKSAPEVKYAEWIADKLILHFANVGRGLFPAEKGSDLKGFSLRGENTGYIEAEANTLFGIRALVHQAEISFPGSCSYAFATFNQKANLRADQGMPVLPFRLRREDPANILKFDWMKCEELRGWFYPTAKDYQPDMPAQQKPGYYPLWSIREGNAELTLEKNNKRSGSAALFLQFTKSAANRIVFEPILSYASLYPPFDFSGWQYLIIELFNADHHEKELSLIFTDQEGLRYETESVIIRDILDWQKFEFSLPEMPIRLQKIVRLQFVLTASADEGDITLDSVRFGGLINREEDVYEEN